jgi:hypothetical protein
MFTFVKKVGIGTVGYWQQGDLYIYIVDDDAS